PLSLPLLYCAAATTALSTLSLHDALPISGAYAVQAPHPRAVSECRGMGRRRRVRRRGGGALPLRRSGVGAHRGPGSVARGDSAQDRKSTRLNSSHLVISYAVFCLKKKTRE